MSFRFALLLPMALVLMPVQAHAQAPAAADIFEIPRLGPRETKTLTITLTGPGSEKGIPRGKLKWERPLLPSGAADMIAIEVPLGQ